MKVKMTCKVVVGEYNTCWSRYFDSIQDAVWYYENRMFTGEQPNSIIMEDIDGSGSTLFSATGTLGKSISFSVIVQREESEPPKELGE